MEILKVNNLSKVYGKGDTQIKAIENVSSSVEKGEFVAIVGPSGSGKWTLLHILGGVDTPNSGQVLVDGTDICAPYQAPNANAFAERWIRTVREECLDHILILNEAHLRRVLREYVESYYNPARAHQGLCQGTPLPHGQPVRSGAMQKRAVLGGIINDYYRIPAQLSTYLS